MFRIIDLPIPVPGPGEVLIRVEAISIEGGDLAARRDGQTLAPRVIGYAAAGIVTGVGPGVDGFQPGDRVTSFAFSGSHAEYRTAPAATTFMIPDSLDMAVAAAIPCGPGTAALALDLGRLKAGETVLVTGATGGVGSAVVQIVAAAGARVIGTSRSRASLDRLVALGLTHGVVPEDTPLADAVKALTAGRGADLLIDTVGGGALLEGLIALADGGRAVMVGVIGGFSTPIDSGVLFAHRLTVTGCFMGPVMCEPGPRALIEGLLAGSAADRFAVPIDARFALADVAAAHRHAETGGKLGRVIVTP